MRSIGITYSQKNGGAAKGFAAFLKAQKSFNQIELLYADWSFSKKNFTISRLNAIISYILQAFFKRSYSKGSLNLCPVINLKKFRNHIIYLGWVGNGMINFYNHCSNKYIIRLSDEWWISDFFHYRLKEQQDFFLFKGILIRKLDFINQKNVTLVFPSEWLKDQFSNIIEKNNQKFKALIIRNQIDNEFLVRAKPNIKRLIFVAHKLNDKNKGYELLLETNSIISKYFNEIIVVGSKEKVEKPKNFIFTDSILKSELINLFKDGGVYIHLSERDNSPNTLIEACTSGLIPIVLGGSGAQEYIQKIDFNSPLIINPKKKIEPQLEKILNKLNNISKVELKNLCKNVQKNIIKMCEQNDYINY